MPMVSTFVAVRTSFKCPECMGPVPLNRVSVTGHCHHCQSSLVLDNKVWVSNILQCWVKPPRTWEVGKRDQYDHDMQAIVLDVERVATAPANATSRVPDELIKHVYPHVVRIYGEAAEGDPTATPIDKPLLFACMECGAGLKVDGSNRVVECQHCNASNFLSDSLWLRIHPALKRQWYVLEYE